MRGFPYQTVLININNRLKHCQNYACAQIRDKHEGTMNYS